YPPWSPCPPLDGLAVVRRTCWRWCSSIPDPRITIQRPPLLSPRSTSCSKTRTPSSEPTQWAVRMPEEHSFPSLENAVLPRQNEDDSGLYQLRKGAWVPRSFTLSTNAKHREWVDHKIRFAKMILRLSQK